MKRIEIEALLRWAYRDELPKAAAAGGDRLAVGFRSGWGGVEKWGELLTLVQEPDIRNRFGLVPDYLATTEPHPDAVRVDEAVERLRLCGFEAPAGWNPIADLLDAAGDLGARGAAAVARGLAALTLVDVTGRTVLRRSVSRLVMRQAILGGCPAWEGDVPELRQETAHGKVRWFRRVVLEVEGAFGPTQEEIELDGYDQKRQRPFPGAYTKSYLDPDPAPVVEARAEYELWRAALDLLAEDLAHGLEAHAVLPSTRSPRPWEAPDPERRVLPSLLVPPVAAPDSRAARRKKNSTGS